MTPPVPLATWSRPGTWCWQTGPLPSSPTTTTRTSASAMLSTGARTLSTTGIRQPPDRCRRCEPGHHRGEHQRRHLDDADTRDRQRARGCQHVHLQHRQHWHHRPGAARSDPDRRQRRQHHATRVFPAAVCTAGNWGPIATGDSLARDITITVGTAGVFAPVAGQAVNILNNFENTRSQLLTITSAAGAAAYQVGRGPDRDGAAELRHGAGRSGGVAEPRHPQLCDGRERFRRGPERQLRCCGRCAHQRQRCTERHPGRREQHGGQRRDDRQRQHVGGRRDQQQHRCELRQRWHGQRCRATGSARSVSAPPTTESAAPSRPRSSTPRAR